ncbi:chaplin, partial [Streptomyces cellulosae]
MKRVTRNSVIAVAAASGAMAVAGPAHADSDAGGYAGGSPGLISGNGIQLPVHVPVNACGNTVDVVGLLNPAMGNRCANQGDRTGGKEGAATSGGATAVGKEQGSPGVISGNTIQVPVHIPLNVCGNTVNVVGLLNPSAGNACENGGHGDKKSGSHRAGSSSTHGGAYAHGGSKDSPGVISGNTIELPVHVPVNVTGNSVNVVGVGNPA